MIDHCNICGRQTKELYPLRFLDIIGMSGDYTQSMRLCEECGFVYTGNPFDADKLANRYKNLSKFEFDDDTYILDVKDEYAVRSKRQQFFIDSLIDDYDSILEIGAASAYNLSLYQNTGKTVYGIEPSNTNCRNAKRIYNIDMFNGTFEEYWTSETRQKFDLIFLSMVLEHIVNPMDFIRQCAELNNKYIFVEVPTFDYKYADEPYGMFCEEHVNCFTMFSLEKLMNNAGYHLIDAQMYFSLNETSPAGYPCIDTLWVKSDTIVPHSPVLPVSRVLDAYLTSSAAGLQRIATIIDSIPDTDNLAIWGTGHHVSMLLANTNLLHKNIIKFYDSDTRKSQFTMVGRSIQPFDETDISDGKIDTILVATYTAQRPIVKILDAYRDKVRVVTLYNL